MLKNYDFFLGSQSLQYTFTTNTSPLSNIYNNKIFLILPFHPLYQCCHSFYFYLILSIYISILKYFVAIIILNKLLCYGLRIRKSESFYLPFLYTQSFNVLWNCAVQGEATTPSHRWLFKFKFSKI